MRQKAQRLGLEIVEQKKISCSPTTTTAELVLDMMEEFRQQLVYRTLIGLITKNVIKPDEIIAAEAVEEGRVLRKEVIKVLLDSLQERLDGEVMFNGQKGSLKSFIHLQPRCMVSFLLKEAEYVPFCLGW